MNSKESANTEPFTTENQPPSLEHGFIIGTSFRDIPDIATSKETKTGGDLSFEHTFPQETKPPDTTISPYDTINTTDTSDVFSREIKINLNPLLDVMGKVAGQNPTFSSLKNAFDTIKIPNERLFVDKNTNEDNEQTKTEHIRLPIDNLPTPENKAIEDICKVITGTNILAFEGKNYTFDEVLVTLQMFIDKEIPKLFAKVKSEKPKNNDIQTISDCLLEAFSLIKSKNGIFVEQNYSELFRSENKMADNLNDYRVVAKGVSYLSGTIKTLLYQAFVKEVQEKVKTLLKEGGEAIPTPDFAKTIPLPTPPTASGEKTEIAPNTPEIINTQIAQSEEATLLQEIKNSKTIKEFVAFLTSFIGNDNSNLSQQIQDIFIYLQNIENKSETPVDKTSNFFRSLIQTAGIVENSYKKIQILQEDTEIRQLVANFSEKEVTNLEEKTTLNTKKDIGRSAEQCLTILGRMKDKLTAKVDTASKEARPFVKKLLEKYTTVTLLIKNSTQKTEVSIITTLSTIEKSSRSLLTILSTAMTKGSAVPSLQKLFQMSEKKPLGEQRSDGVGIPASTRTLTLFALLGALGATIPNPLQKETQTDEWTPQVPVTTNPYTTNELSDPNSFENLKARVLSEQNKENITTPSFEVITTFEKEGGSIKPGESIWSIARDQLKKIDPTLTEESAKKLISATLVIIQNDPRKIGLTDSPSMLHAGNPIKRDEVSGILQALIESSKTNPSVLKITPKQWESVVSDKKGKTNDTIAQNNEPSKSAVEESNLADLEQIFKDDRFQFFVSKICGADDLINVENFFRTNIAYKMSRTIENLNKESPKLQEEVTKFIDWGRGIYIKSYLSKKGLLFNLKTGELPNVSDFDLLTVLKIIAAGITNTAVTA